MSKPAPGEEFLRKIVKFGRVLHGGGIEVGPGRMQDALRGLDVIDITSRDEAYWALRCTLISRHEDIEVFDQAFDTFWGSGEARPDSLQAQTGGGDPREASGEVAHRSMVRGTHFARGEEAEDSSTGDTEVGMVWSAIERLRQLDFSEYEAEEFERASRLVARVARVVPQRRSRRLERAHDGRVLDKRSTLRSAIRTGGHPLERWWRRPRLTPRKLVFLVDISGSMEPYARAMVMFLQAAVGVGRKVEAFTFGTRLTRVTRHLESRDPDRALHAAAKAVPDWAGGTRIGENLKAFNDEWGRGLSRGATIVIVSDGWERGDPGLLSEEMGRLRRVAHSIVWVNPLAAGADYEPLAQGMAAALEYVDVFLPGHDLRSLEGLAEVLEALPAERSQGAYPPR